LNNETLVAIILQIKTTTWKLSRLMKMVANDKANNAKVPDVG